MEFILAYTPYDVQKDREDDHAGYYEFNANDMKDIGKVLEDVMKLGTHEHLFCFVLQFAFR